MRRWIFCVCLASAAGCGTFGPFDIPDQSQFAPLAEITAKDQAFVRLYGDEIAPIQWIAIHLTLILKPAGSDDVQMWELQPAENGPYGHVRFTDRPDVVDTEFFNRSFVIAEVFADRAQSIADFIQTQSPTYSCRFAYGILGPNSNTYIVWILQQTGWDVGLSGRAVGKDATFLCP